MHALPAALQQQNLAVLCKTYVRNSTPLDSEPYLRTGNQSEMIQEDLELMHLSDESPDTDGGVRLPRIEEPSSDTGLERIADQFGPRSKKGEYKLVQGQSRRDTLKRQAQQILCRQTPVPQHESLPIDPLGSITSSKRSRDPCSERCLQISADTTRLGGISLREGDLHQPSEIKKKQILQLRKRGQHANRESFEGENNPAHEEHTHPGGQVERRPQWEQVREGGKCFNEEVRRAEHEAYTRELGKKIQLVQSNQSLENGTFVAKQFNQSSGPDASIAIKTPGFSSSTPSLSSSRRDPHPNRKVPEPCPTSAYLQHSSSPPTPASQPQHLLVVLDLNGTLLARKRLNNSTLRARSGLREFMLYLFQNHSVMIWSSATPASVQQMTTRILTKQQQLDIIQTWARDKFKLNAGDYHQKIQVYKRLELIWDDKHLQSLIPDKTGVWDQSNTVLIDDSTLKAITQPHNHIKVPEYGWSDGQENGMEVLCQVAAYLEEIRRFNDVSRYIRQKRFAIDNSLVWGWKEVK